MTEENDIESLRRRHKELDARIAEEESHPGSDDLHIRELKREKLRLKERIELSDAPAAQAESPGT